MSKIVDFYKVVEENKKLKEELLALNAKYKDRLAENNIKETIENEIIMIADKHDYVLTKEDFAAMQEEEIDEQQLENVAGGELLCMLVGFPHPDTTGACALIGFGAGGEKIGFCIIAGL